MGELKKFNLGEIIERFDSKILIETGSCEGAGIDHALKFPFEKIISIEIDDTLYKFCCEKYRGNIRVQLIQNNSIDGLKSILPINERVIYWLDAHFPGVDTKKTDKKVEDEDDYHRRLPLEKELEAICELSDPSKDFFIIDDLRIYEDGPFTAGNWAQRAEYGSDNIDFIYRLFDKTHTIKRLYDDQGYIILTPKS